MNTEIPLIKLSKVGVHQFAIFKMNDGTTKEVAITEKEFADIISHPPTNPTIKDGAYIGAYQDDKLNTSSGKIEEGTYYDPDPINGESYRMMTGGKLVEVPKTEVISDTLIIQSGESVDSISI